MYRDGNPIVFYADFVVIIKRENDAKKNTKMDRVFVVETKGQHLAGVQDAQGNVTDTGYKRDVFTLCTKLAKEKDWNEFAPFMRGTKMGYEVVDEKGWEARLNELIQDAS